MTSPSQISEAHVAARRRVVAGLIANVQSEAVIRPPVKAGTDGGFTRDGYVGVLVVRDDEEAVDADE
jgi:hypothetical protein